MTKILHIQGKNWQKYLIIIDNSNNNSNSSKIQAIVDQLQILKKLTKNWNLLLKMPKYQTKKNSKYINKFLIFF